MLSAFGSRDPRVGEMHTGSGGSVPGSREDRPRDSGGRGDGSPRDRNGGAEHDRIEHERGVDPRASPLCRCCRAPAEIEREGEAGEGEQHDEQTRAEIPPQRPQGVGLDRERALTEQRERDARDRNGERKRDPTPTGSSRNHVARG